MTWYRRNCWWCAAALFVVLIPPEAEVWSWFTRSFFGCTIHWAQALASAIPMVWRAIGPE